LKAVFDITKKSFVGSPAGEPLGEAETEWLLHAVARFAPTVYFFKDPL